MLVKYFLILKEGVTYYLLFKVVQISEIPNGIEPKSCLGKVFNLKMLLQGTPISSELIDKFSLVIIF